MRRYFTVGVAGLQDGGRREAGTLDARLSGWRTFCRQGRSSEGREAYCRQCSAIRRVVQAYCSLHIDSSPVSALFKSRIARLVADFNHRELAIADCDLRLPLWSIRPAPRQHLAIDRRGGSRTALPSPAAPTVIPSEAEESNAPPSKPYSVHSKPVLP